MWNPSKTGQSNRNSDSSDTDDDDVALPSIFTRKISTNKRLDKSVSHGWCQQASHWRYTFSFLVVC